MRVRIGAFLLMLGVVCTACDPQPRCGGVLYYDPVTTNCVACPKDAPFKDGSCVCKDQYEFVNNKCVLMDGAVLPIPDAGDEDSAASANAGSCNGYCEFTKQCFADNALAAAALNDLVTGLKASDTPACIAACKSDTGGDGSMDPVVACIEAGRTQAACANDDTQTGLGGAITLLGDCCRSKQSNKLCKSICAGFAASPLVKDRVDFCN
jgi:hypothetical protein